MLSTQVLYGAPLHMRSLVLEMEQKPEFKARIRNGELNFIRLRLLLRFGYKRMFVDVEDTPNVIVSEVRVPAGVARRLFLELNRPFNDGLRDAGRHNVQVDNPALQTTNFLKIYRLGHLAFAHD